jgi:hypothetical protein
LAGFKRFRGSFSWLLLEAGGWGSSKGGRIGNRGQSLMGCCPSVDFIYTLLSPTNGPWRGITLKVEYLGEFEVNFETALGYDQRTRWVRFTKKTAVRNLALLSLR